MAVPNIATDAPLMFVWYPIIFTFLMCGLLILFIRILDKLKDYKVDLYDVAYSLCAYASFLFFYRFATSYFADVFILDLMEVFMWIYGFMHLVVPIIALIFSWIKGSEE